MYFVPNADETPRKVLHISFLSLIRDMSALISAGKSGMTKSRNQRNQRNHGINGIPFKNNNIYFYILPEKRKRMNFGLALTNKLA